VDDEDEDDDDDDDDDDSFVKAVGRWKPSAASCTAERCDCRTETSRRSFKWPNLSR